MYNCPICDKSVTLSHLKLHTKVVHEKNLKDGHLNCSACNKSLKKDNLIRHENRCGKFHCLICNKSLVSAGALKNHIKTVHEKLKPFQCDKCEASFGMKHTLDNHFKAIHLTIKAYKCNICGREFGVKGTFKRHVRNVHEKEINYECHFCGNRFGGKLSFDDHVRRKHSFEKLYNCSHCESQFLCDADYKTHILQNNRDKTAVFLSCGVCQQLFLSKTGLDCHVKMIHMETFNFKCPECNKAFPQELALNNHKIEIHDKLKKESELLISDTTVFKCQICKTKFQKSENLNCRTATAHNGA